MFAAIKIWVAWNDGRTIYDVVAVFDSEDTATAWAKIYIGDNRDVEDNELKHVWWCVGSIPFNPTKCVLTNIFPPVPVLDEVEA